jgi:hypothetical protein
VRLRGNLQAIFCRRRHQPRKHLLNYGERYCIRLRNWPRYWIRARICRSRGYFLSASSSSKESARASLKSALTLCWVDSSCRRRHQGITRRSCHEESLSPDIRRARYRFDQRDIRCVCTIMGSPRRRCTLPPRGYCARQMVLQSQARASRFVEQLPINGTVQAAYLVVLFPKAIVHELRNDLHSISNEARWCGESGCSGDLLPPSPPATAREGQAEKKSAAGAHYTHFRPASQSSAMSCAAVALRLQMLVTISCAQPRP